MGPVPESETQISRKKQFDFFNCCPSFPRQKFVWAATLVVLVAVSKFEQSGYSPTRAMHPPAPKVTSFGTPKIYTTTGFGLRKNTEINEKLIKLLISGHFSEFALYGRWEALV